ncbi:MAG: ParB N-terminal domain-containing protein [Patescibacteria group bacterium]|nr:ParB N-terminal domain-containing protein [Patescibacteria group bacterium]
MSSGNAIVLQVASASRSSGPAKGYPKKSGERHNCGICGGHPIDEQACRRLSGASRTNARCAELSCDSPWRVCSACILQGAAKLKRKVAKGGLCQFHLAQGADADIIEAEIIALAEADGTASEAARADMETEETKRKKKTQKARGADAKAATSIPGTHKAENTNEPEVIVPAEIDAAVAAAAQADTEADGTGGAGVETPSSAPRDGETGKTEEVEVKTFFCGHAGRNVDEEQCEKTSLMIYYNEGYCIKGNCECPWRKCISCLRLGMETKGEVNASTGLCKFHSENGERARSNQQVETSGRREIISPILEGNVPSLLVDELVPDPDQPRQTFFDQDLLELGNSILENGQMIPAIILIMGNEKLILDGERRWRSCQKVGVLNLYSIIVRDLKVDKFLLSAICNFGREGHTHIDTVRAVEKSIAIIESMAKKNNQEIPRAEVIKKVATGFCKSTTWVYQYLSFSFLDSDVQEMVRKKELPFVVGVEISKVDEPGDQIDLARKVGKKIGDEGMSANFARQFVRGQIEKKRLSSITKKREHSPKDDYRILRNSVNSALDGLNIILGWGPEKIIGLFYNRKGEDKEIILERLDRTIAKLMKLRETVHNNGSIKDVVQDSVKNLWAADKPGGQEGGTEEE